MSSTICVCFIWSQKCLKLLSFLPHFPSIHLGQILRNFWKEVKKKLVHPPRTLLEWRMGILSSVFCFTHATYLLIFKTLHTCYMKIRVMHTYYVIKKLSNSCRLTGFFSYLVLNNHFSTKQGHKMIAN